MPSALGDWSYEVADTKLAKSAKAKFLIQLAFYSELLAGEQGREPRFMHLALGDGREESFRVADYSHYFRQVRGRSLPEWAAEFDCGSWAQLFLKYIVAEPAVTCVIPATSNPEHMKDDLKAGFGRLPDAGQRRRIREFWDTL